MAEPTTVLERRGSAARYYPELRGRALATRDAMLDELERALAATPWHKVSTSGLIRAAGRGCTAFYSYFPDITAAFEALMQRREQQGLEPTEHMRLVAQLLAFERQAMRHG